MSSRSNSPKGGEHVVHQPAHHGAHAVAGGDHDELDAGPLEDVVRSRPVAHAARQAVETMHDHRVDQAARDGCDQPHPGRPLERAATDADVVETAVDQIRAQCGEIILEYHQSPKFMHRVFENNIIGVKFAKLTPVCLLQILKVVFKSFQQGVIHGHFRLVWRLFKAYYTNQVRIWINAVIQ